MKLLQDLAYMWHAELHKDDEQASEEFAEEVDIIGTDTPPEEITARFFTKWLVRQMDAEEIESFLAAISDELGSIGHRVTEQSGEEAGEPFILASGHVFKAMIRVQRRKGN